MLAINVGAELILTTWAHNLSKVAQGCGLLAVDSADETAGVVNEVTSEESKRRKRSRKNVKQRHDRGWKVFEKTRNNTGATGVVTCEVRSEKFAHACVRCGVTASLAGILPSSKDLNSFPPFTVLSSAHLLPLATVHQVWSPFCVVRSQSIFCTKSEPLPACPFFSPSHVLPYVYIFLASTCTRCFFHTLMHPYLLVTEHLSVGCFVPLFSFPRRPMSLLATA